MGYHGPPHLERVETLSLTNVTHQETDVPKISRAIHLQSTINIEGDKVVGGFPLSADPDNLTSRPLSGCT